MDELAICRKFLDKPSVNPKNGRKLVKDKGPYQDFVKLCKQYGFDVEHRLSLAYAPITPSTQNVSGSDYFSLLIDDIIINYFLLELKNFMSLCLCNKRLYSIHQSNDFWILIYNSYFPDVKIEVGDKPSQGYYNIFRACYRLEKFKENFDYNDRYTLDYLYHANELSLSGLKIALLVGDMVEMVNLRVLDLGKNSIEAIPNGFRNLHNLMTLSLTENRLPTISDEICNLPNLVCLDMSYNIIMKIPAAIGNLVTLTSLKLTKNKLTHIAPETTKLTNLTILELDRNKLTEVPPLPENIKILDLSKNHITSDTSKIKQFIKLEKLELSYNHYDVINLDDLNLPNLTELDLRHKWDSPVKIINQNMTIRI